MHLEATGIKPEYRWNSGRAWIHVLSPIEEQKLVDLK
jgi:hypothetical protein